MGLFEEALVDIEKALKVDINFAKAYRNRARAYVGLNEINLATKDYQKYLEFCPEDEKVKREMGELGGLYQDSFAGDNKCKKLDFNNNIDRLYRYFNTPR